MSSNATSLRGRLERSLSLYTLAGLVLVAALVQMTGCSSMAAPQNDLIETPSAWQVRSAEQTSRLYQVDLTTADGQGRLLVAEYELDRRVADTSEFLDNLHAAMLERVQTQSRTQIAPFSDHAIFWSNGFVGRRTKLRGELGNLPVTLVASTMTNGTHVYLNYGLFFQDRYLELQNDYQTALETMRPLRAATVLHEEQLYAEPESQKATLSGFPGLSQVAEGFLAARHP